MKITRKELESYESFEKRFFKMAEPGKLFVVKNTYVTTYFVEWDDKEKTDVDVEICGIFRSKEKALDAFFKYLNEYEGEMSIDVIDSDL